jgi:cation diffusion facilitator CzcD-associated flavoprotein CzcO
VTNSTNEVEVAVVGAGISGIGAGIELLRRGNTSFVVLEAASELGGTWRDNNYPGIAVDIMSVSYCFSFETAYPWSREFAPGAEILRYVGHCAEKYGVSRHIRFRARVVRSEFDVIRDRWATQLEDGSIVTSRFLIAATGLLSQPKVPAIPGLETFAGQAMHTARWDPDHDLASKRVAVIGTGASAVQIVAEIAPHVRQLRVFQRTPIWVSPRPDRPLRPEARLSLRRFSAIRALMRLVSESGLEFLTFAIVNYRRFPFVVRLLQRYLRFTMRRQIDDEGTAAQLLPDYGLGCKRPTMSNGYLRAFNRDHVHLVTQPIERICAEGVVTRDQTLHEADTIVLATGFLTTEKGNAPSFEVVGKDGVELGQFWEEERLQAYAGVSVPGFPNFFLTAGPYSGGFNWFTALEAHLAHIMGCVEGARARGATRVEVKREVHEAYMHDMWRRAEGTVFKDASCASANSYYLDRHDDASLPLPHTPWWRRLRRRSLIAGAYDFGPRTRDAVLAAPKGAG